MRLWHKDLISVLPDKQLLSQWRECVCIVTNIKNKGTPNHLLVNKILSYNKSHFYCYCCMIVGEMFKRGFSITQESRNKILEYVTDEEMQVSSRIEKDGSLFYGWHNKRYLVQCFLNLQEKYDCGGLTKDEWIKVYNKFFELNEKDIEEGKQSWQEQIKKL